MHLGMSQAEPQILALASLSRADLGAHHTARTPPVLAARAGHTLSGANARA
jgi:hypothetical protein